MNVYEGFKAKAVRTYEVNPDFVRGSSGWKVTLKNPRGNSMTVPFFMGPALTGEPQIADVMECLISDGLAYWNSSGPEDFASEFGYEMETAAERQRVRKIYNSCKSIYNRLQAFLTTEEFEAMAYPED